MRHRRATVFFRRRDGVVRQSPKWHERVVQPKGSAERLASWCRRQGLH